MATFVHLVNPVFVSKPHPLAVAQEVTFECMRVAKSCAPALEITHMSAQYPEDHRIIPPAFQRTKDLTRSILDHELIEPQRKLPFLHDLLERAWAESDADYVIFSNVDISPVPHFYTAVDALIKSGLSSFSINRRTIDDVVDPINHLELLWSLSGLPHPGHDCFIFPRRWIPNIDVGLIIVGVPWIGAALATNLEMLDPSFVVLPDRHLTFHLGNDRPWASAGDRRYRLHNMSEGRGILARAWRANGLSRNPLLLKKSVQSVRASITWEMRYAMSRARTRVSSK